MDSRTRVIYVSHVTSPTAFILPVAEICQKAREQGIITVVDGAHAPGQVSINLDQLGADFYSGNLHKWQCAPKGAAFLYARPEMQKMIEPLTSAGDGTWNTPDPIPWLILLKCKGQGIIHLFLPYLTLSNSSKIIIGTMFGGIATYCSGIPLRYIQSF